MSNRKYIAAGIALIVALVAYLVLRGDDDVAITGAPPARSIAAPTIAVRPPTPPAPNATPAANQQFAADGVARTRALYLEGAVYPPWSKPAGPAWQPFVDWNAPRERVDDSVAEDGKGTIRAALTLDRLYARPGEPIVATLELWRGDRDDRQRAIDFDADGAVQIWDQSTYDVEKWDSKSRTPGYTSVWEHRFRPVPGRPNQRRLSFVPSAIEALDDQVSTRFFAVVYVRTDGGRAMKPLELDFNYAREEPVVVIAKVGDRIDDDGSLTVDFDIDVRIAVPIKVESTLFDASGEVAIAVHQSFWRPESTGKQRASVRFFGRALAERGIAGPYTLSVHGFALRFDREPAELHWRDDRVFTTAPYRADQFSAAEWQDPQKDDMLRTYDELEAGFAAGKL